MSFSFDYLKVQTDWLVWGTDYRNSSKELNCYFKLYSGQCYLIIDEMLSS